MKQTIFVLLCVLCAVSSLNFEITKFKHPNRLIISGGATQASNVQSEVLGYYPASYKDGEYYIGIYLGTPAKPYYVQIDTGSPNLILHTDGCIGCNQLPTPYYKFNPAHTYSSSFQYQPCIGAEKCYGGCTYIAKNPGEKHQSATTDSVQYTCSFGITIGGNTGLAGLVGYENFGFTVGGSSLLIPNVPFGLTRLLQGNNTNTPYSGIFGLGFSTNKRAFGEKNALDVIYEAFHAQDSNFKNAFSLCLPSTINFGDDYSTSNLKWTPMNIPASLTRPIANQVTITAIKLRFNKSADADAGVDLHLNNTLLNYQTINGPIPTELDSGMTGIGLVVNTFEAFRKTLTKLGPNFPGIKNTSPGNTIFDQACFAMTLGDVDAYPDVNIYFDGIDDPITVPSDVWLIQDNNGNYCSAIVPTRKNHGNILGTIFLELSHVVFDRAGARIGFGPPNTC